MNRNGMGPLNSGPMTGRGMGNCNKFSQKNNPGGSAGGGRGKRRGTGTGRGSGSVWRGSCFANQSEAALLLRIKALETEIQTLKDKSL